MYRDLLFPLSLIVLFMTMTANSMSYRDNTTVSTLLGDSNISVGYYVRGDSEEANVQVYPFYVGSKVCHDRRVIKNKDNVSAGT